MNSIKLFNTLSGQKEEFKPLRPGEAGMYQCGPTVYDTAHIGNLRTYIGNDILRRVLEWNGYKVAQVMNFTDVDDKTIKKSRIEGIPLKDLAKKYEDLFMADLESLNILRPHKLLRATLHIGEMVKMIESLIDKGVAYKTADGIYMSIAKVKNYGDLAGVHLGAEIKERIKNDEYEKEDARDFALWKFWTEDDGENFWEAPFGKGRPGWHIECSAMAVSALGETIDIHTGAIDLIFPHHTNEIAQSEESTGKPFVRYWVHFGFMNVSGDKMAKSKGNFLKLADLVSEEISPLSFRMWILGAHYKTSVNFSLEAVSGAQTALKKLIEDIGEMPDGGKPDENYLKKFTEFINDDLNMPKALALVWEILKDDKLSSESKKATILEFDKVLGLALAESAKIKIEIPEEIRKLAEEREIARKNKNWKKSDELRKEIEEKGFEIRDTESGFIIKSV